MITAFGPVRFARRYTSGADGGGYPADSALGVDGLLSRQATRITSLLGITHSFDRAARLLEPLCGWSVDSETIRRSTHATARRAALERPLRADAGTLPPSPAEESGNGWALSLARPAMAAITAHVENFGNDNGPPVRCGPTTRRVNYRFGFASTITPADRHVQ